MVIRQEQMSAFQEDANADFENRMVVHLNKCFPAECQALQEAGVRKTIRYGIDQAAKYDVKAERDVCKYIDVMMVYGRDFDTREDLPWAPRILNDQVLRNSTARMDNLFVAAKEHQAR